MKKVTILKKLVLERSPKTYKEVSKPKTYEVGDILTDVHEDWRETMVANPEYFKIEEEVVEKMVETIEEEVVEDK